MTDSDGLRERSNLDGFAERAKEAFPVEDASLALRASNFAFQRIKDVGEHCRAAWLLLDHHADPIVVAGALLAPVRRYGLAGSGEIREVFGSVIAALVEKVFSEDLLRADLEEHRKTDTSVLLRKLASDVRATILRLGLRLGELERLSQRGGSGAQGIARETIELHVPLADRMGTHRLCKCLEDVCLRLMDPKAYRALRDAVLPLQVADSACLDVVREGVARLIEQSGITTSISGRTKGLYSMYCKMRRTGKPLREIMDRVGLRIVVPSVRDCYTVLDLVHTHFDPVPGAFDDYIAHPKDNGYQSLHTCVYPVPGATSVPVEFQIRTRAMDREAEFGIAAHWQYKTREEAKQAGDRQMRWLGELADYRDTASTHREFVAELRKRVSCDGTVLAAVRVGGELCDMDRSLCDGNGVET